MSAVPIVYVVDDEPAMLKALSRLLRAEGFAVRAFGSADEFLAGHDCEAPGCLVLDLRLPQLGGLALQSELLASGCGRAIVFISGHGEVADSVSAMKAGAVDFLTKPLDDEVFLAAVRSAIASDEHARGVRLELQSIRRRMATLTPREYQVVRHVVAGRLNKQIAAVLGTAEKTVKVHRARAMEKMGAASLAELVRLSLENDVGMVAWKAGADSA